MLLSMDIIYHLSEEKAVGSLRLLQSCSLHVRVDFWRYRRINCFLGKHWSICPARVCKLLLDMVGFQSYGGTHPVGSCVPLDVGKLLTLS